MAITFATTACAPGGHVDMPRDCATFVSKYEACLSASMPASSQIAHARAAQTRAAVEEEARHADLSGLEALNTKCQDNVQRLAATCASPSPLSN